MFLWFIACFWLVKNPFNIWSTTWISGIKKRSWPYAGRKSQEGSHQRPIALDSASCEPFLVLLKYFEWKHREVVEKMVWNTSPYYQPTHLAWRKVCDTGTWKISSAVSFILFMIWRIVNKFLNFCRCHHATNPSSVTAPSGKRLCRNSLAYQELRYIYVGRFRNFRTRASSPGVVEHFGSGDCFNLIIYTLGFFNESKE